MESKNNTTSFTDSVVFEVIKEIAQRSEAGLAKYGTTMDRTDLVASDWVQHAYEEALDMAIYLKRLKKDMLAMEEELSAHRKEADRIAMMKERNTLTWVSKKADSALTTTDGTGVVYTIVPKPNETYTDLEKKPMRGWHH